MAIQLSKGQKINLEKTSGERLEQFCVKVSWGAIKTVKKGLLQTKTIVEDVDLDLSCIMVDRNGKTIDWLYSPDYNGWLKKNDLPLGKLDTFDNALHHSGDERGQGGGDDFSEVVTVDLKKIDSNVEKIFFFLNIYLNEDQSFDFSHIPFARIQMYEGTASRIVNEHMAFDVSTNSDYQGKRAMIMGKLYLKDQNWKFDAIGDAVDDRIFMETIQRILKSYV